MVIGPGAALAEEVAGEFWTVCEFSDPQVPIPDAEKNSIVKT
jgi:hypothetical protein